jgi:hypothetical protein
MKGLRVKKALSFIMAACFVIGGIVITKVAAEQKTERKQIRVSLMLVEMPKTVLDRLGIKREATMQPDAMVNIPLASLVAVLADEKTVTSLTNPVFTVIDGGDVNTTMPLTSNALGKSSKAKWDAIKIEASAQTKDQEQISFGISLEMIQKPHEKEQNPIKEVSSLKTRLMLNSGRPTILGCQILSDSCQFTIVTAEIIKAQENATAVSK